MSSNAGSGTCLTHGSFFGPACPTCNTAAGSSGGVCFAHGVFVGVTCPKCVTGAGFGTTPGLGGGSPGLGGGSYPQIGPSGPPGFAGSAGSAQHRCQACEAVVCVPSGMAWPERCPHCGASPLHTKFGPGVTTTVVVPQFPTVFFKPDPNVVAQTRDLRRRPYWVVDDFEEALADYCGAPYAVAVSSCTAAIFLALMRDRELGNVRPSTAIQLPHRTYIGVVRSVRNAGFGVHWNYERWDGSYWLSPSRVVDAARDFRRACHEEGKLVCLSFHIAKQLPLGDGGAILCDSIEDATWLRAAATDGRVAGSNATVLPRHGWHYRMPPDVAARGLWMLDSVPDEPADRSHSYDLYEDVSMKGTE